MTVFQREDLLRAVPYARRFARALCGAQAAGDALVNVSLRGLLDGSCAEPDARLALYGEIMRRAGEPGQPVGPEEGLTARQRQLLLLTSLEEVPLGNAATLLQITEDEAGLDPAERP